MNAINELKSAPKVSHTKYVKKKSSKISSATLHILKSPNRNSLYEKFVINKSFDKLTPATKNKTTSCKIKFLEYKNLSTISTLKDSPFEFPSFEKLNKNRLKNQIKENHQTGLKSQSCTELNKVPQSIQNKNFQDYLLKLETPQKSKNFGKFEKYEKFEKFDKFAFCDQSQPIYSDLTKQAETIYEEKKSECEPNSPFFKLEDIVSASDNMNFSLVVDFSPTFSSIGEEGPKYEMTYEFATPSTIDKINSHTKLNIIPNQYSKNNNELKQNRNINRFTQQNRNRMLNQTVEQNSYNKLRALSFEIQSQKKMLLQNSNNPCTKTSFLKIEEELILEKRIKAIDDELRKKTENSELINIALNSSRIKFIIAFLEYLKDRNEFYYSRRLLNNVLKE